MDATSKTIAESLSERRLLQLFWATEIALILILIHQLFVKNLFTTLGVTVIALSLSSVYFFAKKGKTAIGGNILLLMLSLMMLTFMWMYEGIRDEVLLLFPAIFMFSLHIGRRKLTFFLYLIICINVIIIAALNELGYVEHGHTGSHQDSAVVILIILSVIAYSVWLISKDMKEANRVLESSKEELECRVKERTSELEASLNHLTQTQEQLVESEKMASLGRLVAGVAHEINTPLGIAITASSHLESATKDFAQLFESNAISKNNLEKQIEVTSTSSALIMSNLNRAANLVRSFKDVAVDQSSDKRRSFDLKEYIEEVLMSLAPKTKNTAIKSEFQCPKDIILLTIPGSLAQIITNLFINSLTHGFENQKQGLISIDITEQTDNIGLSFGDNGCGMSPEDLSQIFEPFFTTKRGSGGSGLGMHIVYNLVRQSLQGSITCTSILGEGTKFELLFPRMLANQAANNSYDI